MITINLSIELDVGDLVALGSHLAALLNAPTSPPLITPTSPPARLPTTTRTKPTKRPTIARTSVLPPTTPASTVRAEKGDSAPVETQAEPKDRKPYTPSLPIDKLDPLVRSELKRLSMDGRICGYKLWYSERDPRLPTMQAIIRRYNCADLIELAGYFGMEPPLNYRHATAPTNGVTS